MSGVMLEGMNGLGDNIYQRPFLRYFPGSYIKTPWPEVYSDMDVFCVRSNTSLRTQHKNENRTRCQYFIPPMEIQRVRIGYGPSHFLKR